MKPTMKYRVLEYWSVEVLEYELWGWGMGYGVWGMDGPPGAWGTGMAFLRVHRSGYGYGLLAVAPEAPGMGYDQMMAGRTARGMGYAPLLYPCRGPTRGRPDCAIAAIQPSAVVGLNRLLQVGHNQLLGENRVHG